MTKEYFLTATPGKGRVTYDAGYIVGSHQNEIQMAILLYSTLGGDIRLLTESTVDGEKRADYLWNGKLWDLKSVTTEKAANTAIKRGLAQIKPNPGGIILDYGDIDISTEYLQVVINKRMQWLADGSRADIIIIRNGKIVKILRYRK